MRPNGVEGPAPLGGLRTAREQQVPPRGLKPLVDLITRLAPGRVIWFLRKKQKTREGANHVDYRL
jgi:hypothetical protein